MSRMIWFNIFSGFSDREMRSLMFDLMTVDSFVKMLMASAPSFRTAVGSPSEILDSSKVTRRRILEALHRSL